MKHIFAILVLFSLTSCYRPVHTQASMDAEYKRLELMSQQRRFEQSVKRAVDKAILRYDRHH